MNKKPLPLARVYGFLEPGPVVLVTTSLKGKPNVMTMSWHMMMEFEPPLLACVIGGRSRTFDNLVASGECVINIPGAELAEQVVGCGNVSGRRINKFRAFGLTAKPAACVQAPLIDECFANLECRVRDRRWVSRYNLFVLEVVEAWVARRSKLPRTLHHLGHGRFMIAGKIIELPSKAK